MASYMGHEYTPAPTQVVQGRYRVGDRVRVVKDGGGEGGSGHGAAVGSVLEVEEENDCGVLAGGWFLWWGEFAPSFLPGDKVRVTRCNGYFAAGDEGVVEKQGKYNVFVKHGPYQRVGLPIEAEKLELVEAAQPEPWLLGEWDAADCLQDNEQPRGVFTMVADKFVIADHRPAIVALTKNGQPRPADRPYVHASVQAATQEAERLAKNNPGQEFAVYQRVAGRVCETTYNMKEVA